MRVLLLVATIACLAFTASAQTATVRFWTNANCTGDAPASGTYSYTSGATTGNTGCAALTGAKYIANQTTYISNGQYTPLTNNALGVRTGAWSFNLNSNANNTATCTTTNQVATAALVVVEGVGNSDLSQCTQVISTGLVSPTNTWYVRVTSAASSAAISALVGLVAVVATVATSL